MYGFSPQGQGEQHRRRRPSFSSPRTTRYRREVPTKDDVQAALEPLTGLLKMVKATGPDSVPKDILRRPEFHRAFCRPRGAGVTGRCSQVLERWHEDTGTEAGEETPGPGQRVVGPTEIDARQSCPSKTWRAVSEEDWTTGNRDENIIDEFKVSLENPEECVESTIRQSIVVRREVVSVRN